MNYFEHDTFKMYHMVLNDVLMYTVVISGDVIRIWVDIRPLTIHFSLRRTNPTLLVLEQHRSFLQSLD